MRHCCAVLLLAAAACSLAADTTSCGSANPSTVVDCEKVDLGSCGNACCIVETVWLANAAETLYVSLRTFLESGGPDGSFAYVNGSDAAGHNPSDDLRKYKIPQGWQFIFQGTHTTSGGYVDTLDFAIMTQQSASNPLTKVKASSKSNIHGALGDNGQNYKTLAYIAKHAGVVSPLLLNILYGCSSGLPS